MSSSPAFRELSAALDAWVIRLRLQRALTWALRGLEAGLALALLVGGAGLLQERLLRSQFLLLVVSLALLGPALAALTAYLWPLPRRLAAPRLDRMLGLRERLSTALEFDEAQRVANPMLRRQLEDAVEAARLVRPARLLPLRLRLLEALPAVLLLALLGLMWARGEAWFQAAQRTAAVRQAAAQQQQKIEQTLAEIQKSNSLTEAQKQALSQPLQEALQGLKDNPSLESAVSVLASSGEELQALSDPGAQQLGQALQQAGSQLAGQSGPLQSLGQALAQGDTVSAASQLQQLDVGKMSAAEKQQLASQLQSLAHALGAGDPALASQLEAAAQALQNGDSAAAQQALSDAAKSLAQAGQQVTFSQVAGQAQQALQQGAGQILAAGGGQPQPGQGPGQANNGQDQSSGQGQAGSGQGSSSSGQGPGQGSQGGEAPNTPIDQNNGPGNGGESTYEQIYAPSLLGGQNGQTVTLPGSDASGNVIGQRPSAPGQPGQSLVPYQQVLGQYEQVNQQALESGSIPLEFMQIIHDYFDSIKP